VIPDDGGEDVFVHQNNIDMEGFRYLKPGEHVNYELEVGEKGLKAVQVNLLSERAAGDSPFGDQPDERNGDRGGERYGDRGGDRYASRPPARDRYADRGRERPDQRRAAPPQVDERLQSEVEKLRRKQERLISLLVAKGVLAPGEIDGLEGTQAVDSAAYDDAES
jgi:CspA family cold shock protein